MPSAQAQAYVLNASVVPDGPLGYLTLWPDGVQQPLASTLNALDGFLTNNMAIVPTNNGKIDAFASGTTQLILDISAYFAPLPPLSITTTSLPGGTINVPYSSTLAASGGEPPYNWSVIGGSLPPGLGLSSDGVISGTPTAGGLYNVTVQVADTLLPVPDTASAMLSITIQTGGLVITTMSLPAGTVDVPYSATLGASGGTPPYAWSVISGTLPVGLSLNMSSGVILGTPTVAGGSNFTVQVTDSSSPPVMATAPLGITINAANTTAALSGPYAFSFSGYNNGSPVVMAGSFIADGNGNITSGVLDINNASSGPQLQVPLTGTYSIQANGLGTMTLTPQVGSPLVFSVAISNKGITGTTRNGNLILRDPANPGSYGSGVIVVQNSLQFNLPALQGNYALGYSGVDPSLKRVAGAAAYQMVDQQGTLSNGVGDIDDNGVPASTTFTGTFGAPDGQTGRGTATLITNGSLTTHYAYYIVSSGQIIMVSTDPISPANLTLWSIARQSSTAFTDASLNGVGVVELNGTDVIGGSPVSEAEAGLLTTDGMGGGSLSIDQNDGGMLNQFSSSGTYNVAANGRVTLSSSFQTNPPILYLVSQNQAFVVGTDSLVTSGILDAQSGGPPFTNSSIIGTYLGGTVTPVLPSVTNAVSWAFADGGGHINLSLTTSGPSGPGSSQFQGTYQLDGTGRGVLTLNGSPAGVVYAVSPQRFVVLPNTAGPVLSTFTRGSTN